jgi:CDP-L-myo-inositol myo-inositolphosphotransferase
MKGLILAAGEGIRLQRSVNIGHKGLVNLGGLKIIERVILAFHKYSVSDIIIVTGYNGYALKSYLGSGEMYGVKIHYIENSEWNKGIGTSLHAARKVLCDQDQFLISMADHWYEPEVLGRVLNNSETGNLLCIDKNIQDILDLEDATKVDVDGTGLIYNIGKEIKQYNAIDCGIFILTGEIFDALQESFNQDDYSLTGGVRVLARERRISTFDITGQSWQDIDTDRDLKESERKLFTSLKGKGDRLVSRHLNRHISIPITKTISNIAVSPNLISIMSFLLCLVSGLLFALGNPLWILIAGILAQFSSIIDGVDGELARLKFRSSRYGSYLDSILDRYGDATIILGITYHLITFVSKPWIILAGFLVLMGSNMSMMSKDAFYRSYGKRYNPSNMDGPAKYLFAGRDGRLFLIFLGGVTNQLLLTMTILAVITNLLAVYRLLNIKRLKSQNDKRI